MQVTRRGRDDEHGADEFRGEQWLRMVSENPDILLFISNVELDAIQSSSFLVMDGTFDKCPAEFEGGQIYTMHTELNGEALPVGQAIPGAHGPASCRPSTEEEKEEIRRPESASYRLLRTV